MNERYQHGAPPQQNSGYAQRPQQNTPSRPLQQVPNERNGYCPDPRFNGQNQGNMPSQQMQHPQQMPQGTHAQHGAELDKDKKRERAEWFLQLNTFGGKHAFQVESNTTKNGWFTVNVEAAERENPNDPNNKRYLWSNKTVLQMTKSELPVFAAVMLGLLPSARFDNHDSKWLEIENQAKNFFIKCGAPNKGIHVAPVPTVEAYMYGTLALTQYCRNFNGLSTEAGLEIIKALAAQLANCGGYKLAQKR